MLHLLRTELRYSLPKLWFSAVIFVLPALMLLVKGLDDPGSLSDLASDYGIIMAFAAFSSIALFKNWNNLLTKDKRSLLVQPLPIHRPARRQMLFWMTMFFHLPIVVPIILLTLRFKSVHFELPPYFMVNSLLLITAIVSLVQAMGVVLSPKWDHARTVTTLLGVVLLVFPLMLFADTLLSTYANLVAHPAVSIVAALVTLVGTWLFASKYRGLEYLRGVTS